MRNIETEEGAAGGGRHDGATGASIQAPTGKTHDGGAGGDDDKATTTDNRQRDNDCGHDAGGDDDDTTRTKPS